MAIKVASNPNKMPVSISAIYPEAGINFPVSYKFNKLLRIELTALDERLHFGNLVAKDSDYTLGIILSAKSNISTPEIKGPTVSKRHKVVDYVLYIPFDIMINKETFFVNYVSVVCDGVLDILSKYVDVNTSEITNGILKFKDSALKMSSELHQFSST